MNIRRARAADAPGIGAVHVACWRSTYPGVLPDQFLTRLSVTRQAGFYDRAIRLGAGVHVATSEAGRVVGFSTARRSNSPFAEGEVETLYVLDDFKELGFGRRLLRASARYLSALGCGSVFVWVLRDNHAAFFYEHLGGRRVATSMTRVGGSEIPQTAFAWNPIDRLLEDEA
jgi:ribosomal protein S18 acetylase RimI-like enzyme